jgi:hypothetical protein
MSSACLYFSLSKGLKGACVGDGPVAMEICVTGLGFLHPLKQTGVVCFTIHSHKSMNTRLSWKMVWSNMNSAALVEIDDPFCERGGLDAVGHVLRIDRTRGVVVTADTTIRLVMKWASLGHCLHEHAIGAEQRGYALALHDFPVGKVNLCVDAQVPMIRVIGSQAICNPGMAPSTTSSILDNLAAAIETLSPSQLIPSDVQDVDLIKARCHRVSHPSCLPWPSAPAVQALSTAVGCSRLQCRIILQLTAANSFLSKLTVGMPSIHASRSGHAALPGLVVRNTVP